MPANRIQPRTWFVELRLSAPETPSDDDVRSCIKDILDMSNNSRTIRGLQHVSFAYSFRDPNEREPTQPDLAGTQLQSIVVDAIGFAHCKESILDTTMHSWIQDSRVMDQRWTPVYVTPGQSSNWMQTDIIKNFFADCDRGRRVRVDWLWTGDASGSISKGGRPNRRQRGPDAGEISLPDSSPSSSADSSPSSSSPPTPAVSNTVSTPRRAAAALDHRPPGGVRTPLQPLQQGTWPSSAPTVAAPVAGGVGGCFLVPATPSGSRRHLQAHSINCFSTPTSRTSCPAPSTQVDIFPLPSPWLLSCHVDNCHISKSFDTKQRYPLR